MNNRASQSIRVGTTTGVFVAIILKCNDVTSLVNPGYKNNEQQAYPTIDTTMHIAEKKVRECKGCARFPMARIVVSTKKTARLMISVSLKRFYLQAPEAPKTPIKAILESIFTA
jgi:hypothetical protein